MEFRTAVIVKEERNLVRHSDKVLLLGSCFSDNIGGFMHRALMRVMINPLGALYNPLSIAAAVDRIVDCRHVEGRELFEHAGVWSSYDFHSRHSLPDKDATLARMNELIDRAHRHLAECDLLTVTLGSAFVYRLRDTGKVVTNCHRQPPTLFRRELLTVDESTAALRHTIERVREFNPSIRIIVTVSPIRHVADGLDRNALSKAILRVAADAVTGTDGAVYFPAFEIVTDDLRDYRFYAADMTHPSDTAIEYTWQLLQGAYMDDRDVQAVARCERVSRRLAHRPMSASREAVTRFLSDTRQVVNNLIAEYPYVADTTTIKDFLEQ